MSLMLPHILKSSTFLNLKSDRYLPIFTKGSITKGSRLKKKKKKYKIKRYATNANAMQNQNGLPMPHAIRMSLFHMRCLGADLLVASSVAAGCGRRSIGGGVSSRSALVPALRQADIHALRNVGRNIAAELLNVLAINRLGEAQRRVHNVRVQAEEVLGDLGGSGVLAVERSNEDRGLALVVDLIVDAALREDGALELGEGAGDLGVLARGDEAVLEDVAEVYLALHDGKELRGARVNMGCVDSAGIKEAQGG